MKHRLDALQAEPIPTIKQKLIAESQAVLDEVAQLDLKDAAEGNTLRIAAWSLLSAARRATSASR